MNLPIELLGIIFSFHHPWDYRHYCRVSKATYSECEQIKYVLDSTSMKNCPLLNFSDIMKLSLLYKPIEESKHKYDPLSLTYYELENKQVLPNPSILRCTENPIALMCAHFDVHIDKCNIKAYVQILKGERFTIEYLRGPYTIYDQLYMSDMLELIPSTLGDEDLLHSTSKQILHVHSGHNEHIEGNEYLINIDQHELNELVVVIATCGYLTYEDKIKYISNIQLSHSTDVYNGIIGNKKYDHPNLYKLGLYLTWKVGVKRASEITLMNIDEQGEFKEHSLESLFEKRDLGLVYMLKGDFPKYFEWRHSNELSRSGYIISQVAGRRGVRTNIKVRGILGIRSGCIDLFESHLKKEGGNIADALWMGAVVLEATSNTNYIDYDGLYDSYYDYC